MIILSPVYYVELDWKPFSVPLDKLSAAMKVSFAGFDGAIASPPILKLVFTKVLTEADRQAVLNYWNSITEQTFAPTIDEIIQSRLIFNRTKARALKDAIYISNTKSGISVQHSAYLVNYLLDLSHCIDEGLLPTAFFIADTTPVDDVYTQERKDTYKNLIMAAMNG